LSISELRELCAELGALVKERRLAFLSAPSSQGLHELRVAVRSARSLIVLTKTSFESTELNAVRHAGARISYLTGRARNLDVFIDHWRDLTLELSPDVVVNLGPVLTHINSVRESEYRIVYESMNQPECTEFEDELLRLARLSEGEEPADVVVRKAIKRINKRVVDVANSLSDLAPDEVLHKARKDLKKLRYSLEMTRSHFPARSLDKFVETVTELQVTIGRHQDAVMFSNELWSSARRLGPSTSPDVIVSVGILLNPIEDVRRQARRKSLTKLRAYADDEIQQQLKKLVGNID
jgi:CHAD domain-containing protein